MKPIEVNFSQGVQFPPKLGTLILKKTANGKLAYAQNVDSSNDEYGSGVITPGPALITIGNNNILSGVPWLKTYFRANSLSDGFLYFAQGLLGTKRAVLNRIKNVVSGQTPVIDDAISGGGFDLGAISPHNIHANPTIVDMVLRPSTGGNYYLYVSVKDDTDCWLARVDIGSNGLATNIAATNGNFTGGFTNQFLVRGSDNNIIYWIGKDRVSSLDASDVYQVNALADGLPLGQYASCGVDWNGNLMVALSSEAFGDFNQRFSAGQASLALWNYNSPAITNSAIQAPCRYISALVVHPNGNLIAFGGVNEGKSSLYEFTGYGFSLLYTYIGDLPRSHHSVEFDGQGRILWQTADGQLCRYDKSTGIFDHLGTMSTSGSAGGFLARAIGSPIGNEFFTASGTGVTYTIKRVAFGNFTGDGDIEGANTPRAVSGIEQLPFATTISAITWNLSRTLQPGEKVQFLVYTNGEPTPLVYSTLDYAVDGAESAKRDAITLTEINSFSLGIVWHSTDGLATAPGVLPAIVEVN